MLYIFKYRILVPVFYAKKRLTNELKTIDFYSVYFMLLKQGFSNQRLRSDFGALARKKNKRTLSMIIFSYEK